jgi:hypothetical protein
MFVSVCYLLGRRRNTEIRLSSWRLVSYSFVCQSAGWKSVWIQPIQHRLSWFSSVFKKILGRFPVSELLLHASQVGLPAGFIKLSLDRSQSHQNYIYSERGNRDSSVGIATGYGLDCSRGRSSSRNRRKIFLLSTSSTKVLGPTQPQIKWVPGALSGERGKAASACSWPLTSN